MPAVRAARSAAHAGSRGPRRGPVDPGCPAARLTDAPTRGWPPTQAMSPSARARSPRAAACRYARERSRERRRDRADRRRAAAQVSCSTLAASSRLAGRRRRRSRPSRPARGRRTRSRRPGAARWAANSAVARCSASPPVDRLQVVQRRLGSPRSGPPSSRSPCARRAHGQPAGEEGLAGPVLAAHRLECWPGRAAARSSISSVAASNLLRPDRERVQPLAGHCSSAQRVDHLTAALLGDPAPVVIWYPSGF